MEMMMHPIEERSQELVTIMREECGREPARDQSTRRSLNVHITALRTNGPRPPSALRFFRDTLAELGYDE